MICHDGLCDDAVFAYDGGWERGGGEGAALLLWVGYDGDGDGLGVLGWSLSWNVQEKSYLKLDNIFASLTDKSVEQKYQW